MRLGVGGNTASTISIFCRGPVWSKTNHNCSTDSIGYLCRVLRRVSRSCSTSLDLMGDTSRRMAARQQAELMSCQQKNARANRSHGRFRRADEKRCSNASESNRTIVTRAAANGSAQPARRHSAPTVTTLKACGSASTVREIGSAVKVWERRDYRNLDDSVELGTRNIKIALRRVAKICSRRRRRSA